ncbi:MAG TPA: hypothetical protein VLA20_12965, partial [Vicinamibacterales bacterium]|nr:hypothetical protein [Vicinamibacterales bacterium]
MPLKKICIALFCLLFVILIEPKGSAQTADPPLNFFKNYFVTGDYLAAGVGLTGQGSGGVATGPIRLNTADMPA